METKSIRYFRQESRPFGLSFGQWTVKWWQWFLSIPSHIHPGTDETGNNAYINQSDRNVWFLAGTFGGRSVQRKCQIPNGRSILFPIINYEMNAIENPMLNTESELAKHVIQDQDDIISLDAVVDGQKIPIYRVRSQPSFFTINVPDDNPLQIPGGAIRATADGFWAFLEPLPLGEHEIYFSGSCSLGTRNVKAKYYVSIV